MSKKESKKNFWGVLGKLHSDAEAEVETAEATEEIQDLVTSSASRELLTVTEKQRLEECETIIEKGLQTFIEVGQVLLEIKDRRLYREEYGTFETYCGSRWGLSRPRAYQLIQATNVVNNLSAASDVLPTTESQARPLSKLSAEDQLDTWNEVVQESQETGKSITAKSIEKKVSERLKKKTETSTIVDTEVLEAEVNPENLSTIVDRSELIKKIRGAVADAEYEIMIEVSGKWLLRSGLSDIWTELRQTDELHIDEGFKDYITLKQAEMLGIIKKA
jgi:hypothetical protein